MINFRSGPALSLHQTNVVGAAVSGQAIEAGMVVRYTDAGTVLKGTADPDAVNEILGFAINDQADGDSIESGKIGVYLLDGASVVETTNFYGDASTYAVGAQVSARTDGLIGLKGTSDRVIGQVVGARDLPAAETISGVKIQGTATFVAIKLAV